MPTQLVPGARGRSLANSLAGLGLVKVLAEQAHLSLSCCYTPDGLVIETAVEDVASWLVEKYRPTPVLSPWNEGSGFGAKDKAPKDALSALLALPSPRLDDFRRSYDVVSLVAVRARQEGWGKPKIIREVRDRCPDEMLPWLDAAVIALDGNNLAFPPLLGTGGNDGRLDFSTNFHQRLLDVLQTSEPAPSRSLSLAHDWLNATSTEPLVKGAVGQFDPGAAGTPNSSPYGSADSVVNPWIFVLMVEGTTLFGAAPARRLAEQIKASPRAAMTFTTFGSPFGSSAGTSSEDSRGEVWFPWWDRLLSYDDIRLLFSEGRAVWRGRTATQSGDMYLAAASQGVSMGVAGFDRYTLVKRNGLAFSAVFADSIVTRAETSIQLIADVEDWPNRVAQRTEAPGSVRRAVDRFGAARVMMAREATRARQFDRVRGLLLSVTELELAVGRSGHTRDEVGARRPYSAQRFADLLSQPSWEPLRRSQNFRIALGLASLITGPLPDAPRGRSLRELMLPIDPLPDRGKTANWRESALVPGLGFVPLRALLADVAQWLTIAAMAEPPKGRDGSEVGRTGDRPYGVFGAPLGIRVPSSDLHTWVPGFNALEEADLESWLLALLALDWRGVRVDLPRTEPAPADPTFAILAPFRDRMAAARDDEAPRYGLTSEWMSQLYAGHVGRVHTSAVQRLRQLGYDAVSAPIRGGAVDPVYGQRLAAALLPRSTGATYGLRRATRPLAQDTSDDLAASEQTDKNYGQSQVEEIA